MGREIRRVDSDWEHPMKQGYGHQNFQPVFNEDFDSVFTEWVDNNNLWKAGKHPDQEEYPEDKNLSYWEWAGEPPNPYYYLKKPFKNPTWYQLYETVSEGTPLTPKFETTKELVDYLVENGDFWNQSGWDRKDAEKFVNIGWCPSGIAIIEDKT